MSQRDWREEPVTKKHSVQRHPLAKGFAHEWNQLEPQQTGGGHVLMVSTKGRVEPERTG